MLAIETTIVVVDFETTGVVGDHPAEPWQIGLVWVRNGQVDLATSWESLLRTGERPFNRFAPGRWHELRHRIAAAPTLEELMPLLRQHLFVGVPAAHNAATERSVLERSLPFHPAAGWLDTLTLARIAWPGLNSYALEDLVVQFGIDAFLTDSCPGRNAHDALYDATASACLLQLLLQAPGWQSAPIETLLHLSTPSRKI